MNDVLFLKLKIYFSILFIKLEAPNKADNKMNKIYNNITDK